MHGKINVQRNRAERKMMMNASEKRSSNTH